MFVLTVSEWLEVTNWDLKFKRSVTTMATILVDYENVSTTDGLKGVEYLNENDTLIIFYSQCCEKIRAEYIEMIEKSQCEFKTYKLARTGKNALDFYIAVECGILGVQGEKQISIISKDKGFSAVSDFFKIQVELDGVVVRVASNVENALVALNTPEDEARKKQIKEKTRTLSIDAEQARIMEYRAFVEKIKKAFEGTEYEAQTEKIIRFIEGRDAKTPRVLYTGSMHEFGREDGRAIYQVLKQVV